MNIFDLPLEIIEKIFLYVPYHLAIALTCKAFYDISCRIKCYKTTLQIFGYPNHSPGIDVREMEKNESLVQSIVNSKRRIKTMTCTDRIESFNHPKTLMMLFESFKDNLSELILRKCKMSLKHFVTSSDDRENFQLDLPNLKELIINSCPSTVLDVFHYLPDNVLTKVEIKWCRGNTENVLINQRKIKEITWMYSDDLAIDTRNLQLQSLELCVGSYSRELLTGQGSLTSLKLRLYLIQADIDTISTLEHLEHLEFYIKSFLNLSALEKLMKLKKLKVRDETDHGISLEGLKSFSVKDLTVFSRFFDQRLAVIMARNCPNIRNLRIKPYFARLWSFCLNTLLEKLPKLESFSTSWPLGLTFPSGFENRYLKRLSLGDVSDSPEFKILLESCVGLKTLKIRLIDLEQMKSILTARPNLKDICVERVERFNVEFVNTFWELGKNLKSFHIKWRLAEDKRIKREMQENNGGLPYSALMKAVRAKKTCCKEKVLIECNNP